MNIKNKLFVISVACGLSFNLAAEAPGESAALFGAPASLVLEEAGPSPAGSPARATPRTRHPSAGRCIERC